MIIGLTLILENIAVTEIKNEKFILWTKNNHTPPSILRFKHSATFEAGHLITFVLKREKNGCFIFSSYSSEQNDDSFQHIDAPIISTTILYHSCGSITGYRNASTYPIIRFFLTTIDAKLLITIDCLHCFLSFEIKRVDQKYFLSIL